MKGTTGLTEAGRLAVKVAEADSDPAAEVDLPIETYRRRR